MARENRNLKRKLVEVGGWRLVRAIPYVGTVAALGLVGYDIKKKGLVKGVINSGLDAIPLVGLGKNVIEYFTGDLLSDKEESSRYAPQHTETSKNKD